MSQECPRNEKTRLRLYLIPYGASEIVLLSEPARVEFVLNDCNVAMLIT